jgi:hypothetical protein
MIEYLVIALDDGTYAIFAHSSSGYSMLARSTNLSNAQQIADALTAAIVS